MYSGGHQVQRSPTDPTSPPRGALPGKRAVTGKIVGGSMTMDTNQLKARLYASSEVHSSSRPQLKVVRRRRSKTDEGTLKAKHPRLDPLPVLSAYQRHLHHDIHGPNEPLPSSLQTRLKSGTVQPLRATSTSPLPELPNELLVKQRSLTELRDVSSPTTPTKVQPPTTSVHIGRTSSSIKTSPVRTSYSSSVRKSHSLSIGREQSSALLLNSNPEQVLTRYYPPLETITDPFEIVNRLRKEPELGFLYLTPLDDQKSVHYNPYNLRVVVHSKVNPSDYSTLSSSGVTRLLNGKEADFVELNQWIKDYKHYQQLIRIKTFAKFRLWKAFSVWRKNVRWRKMEECKKSLEANLFILHPKLCPALLVVRGQCEVYCESKQMAAIEDNTTYTLEEFKTCHITKMKLVAMSLSEFHKWVKEVLRRACEEALMVEGFVPDPVEDIREASPVPGGGPVPLSLSPVMSGAEQIETELVQLDSKEKMTYTEQASKRKHCQRLTSFIRLCDFIVVTMLHDLSVRSASTILTVLQDQVGKSVEISVLVEAVPDDVDEQEKALQEIYETVGYTPAHLEKSTPTRSHVNLTSSGMLQGTPSRSRTHLTPSRGTPMHKMLQLQSEAECKLCLFKSHLMLETDELYYEPSQEEFKGGLSEILTAFQDCTLAFPNLTPDSYFHSFTRPLINGKLEDKTCGDGPSLESIFEDDVHLQQLIESILGCMDKAFVVADEYRSKFEPYRAFYNENENLDVQELEQSDHDVFFYRKWLGKYRLEHIQAKSCPTERDLGLILVDTNQLKAQLLPSPVKCLEVLHDVLPYKAKTMMESLIQTSQDAVIKLEGEPASTLDFVNLLQFIDKIQEQIDDIEESSGIVKDLYDLVNQYQVPVNPEDLAVYQSLRPEVTRLRTAVDKATSSREQYVDKFCNHLDKDISELGRDVKEIKNQAQVPTNTVFTSKTEKQISRQVADFSLKL